MKRKLGLFGGFTALAVAVTWLTTPAAAAATGNPFGPCGAGSVPARMEAVVRDGDPTPVATFHLRYNPVIDSFCGVTIKSRYVGVNTQTMAGVGGASGTVIIDSGPRRYFAGPVWERPVLGPDGRCVSYGASLTDPYGRSYYHETANPAIGWSQYCRR